MQYWLSAAEDPSPPHRHASHICAVSMYSVVGYFFLLSQSSLDIDRYDAKERKKERKSQLNVRIRHAIFSFMLGSNIKYETGDYCETKFPPGQRRDVGRSILIASMTSRRKPWTCDESIRLAACITAWQPSIPGSDIRLTLILKEQLSSDPSLLGGRQVPW